jgi:hypothetical protein
MNCNVGSDLCYVAPYSSTVAANTRQAYCGMIACLADSDPGATFTYGQLWWDFEIELLDVCPTTSGLPTAATLSSAVSGPTSSSNESKFVALTTNTTPNPNLGPLPVLEQSSELQSVGRAGGDYLVVDEAGRTSSSSARLAVSQQSVHSKK